MSRFLKIMTLMMLICMVGCTSAESEPQTQVEPTTSPATATPPVEPAVAEDVVEAVNSAETTDLTAEELTEALFKAVRKDEIETVTDLLASGADVNTVDGGAGFTPIFIAVIRSNTDMLNLLMEAGSDLNQLDKRQNNLLHHAAAAGDTEVAKLILGRGETDVEQHRQKWQFTPLHVAAMEGHTEIVELLVAHGANLQSFDEAQDTPLNIAAWQGHLGTIERLIELGAEPIVVNKRGRSGIDHANNNNHANVATYLTSFQASDTALVQDMTQEEKDDALFEAVRDDDVAELSALIEAGANVNATEKAANFSPIFIATIRDNLETFNILLEAGADVTLVDKQRNTLLHHMASGNSVEMANALLAHSDTFDLEQRRQQFGFTPLLVAAFEGSVEMVELLVANGADIEANDNWGDTPVNVAAWNGKLESIQVLLALGANPNVVNSGGETALTYSQSQNHPEVEAFLRTVVDG